MPPLTEKRIREIFREEIANFLKNDRFVFDRLIQILDGKDIQTGRTTGTKFGTATDQLLAFYGITPVNQPDTVADPGDAGAAYVQSEAQDTVDQLKAVIDRLQELGLIQ